MTGIENHPLPLLELRELTVVFDLEDGRAAAVDRISMTVGPGETVALVGESGSGKSALAYAILRLTRPPGRIESGEIRLDGRDLMTLDPAQLREVRGRGVSIIFQEPSTSLNPVMRVGEQIGEAMLLHGKTSRAEVSARVMALLRRVGIPAPELRASAYPHELSGGMRQRVMIAMALACRPKLLVADEPTTALDVTVQAQVLNLLGDLKQEFGMAILLITHDLGVVSQWSDRLIVIYAGRKMEEGPTMEVLEHPRHPYTRALIASRPDATDGSSRLREIPGVVPALTEIPRGCAFADRCALVEQQCRAALPPLAKFGPAHWAACIVAARKEAIA